MADALPLPELLAPGTRHYDAPVMAEAEAWFRSSGEFRPDAALVEREAAALRRACDAKKALLRMVLDQGAVAAGIAPLSGAFVYGRRWKLRPDLGRAP